MLVLFAFAGVAGALLGLRFKVLILVPVISAVVIMTVAGGLIGGAHYSSTMVAAVLVSVALQLGFIVGSLSAHGFYRASTASSIGRLSGADS